jgi:hypothetical protein
MWIEETYGDLKDNGFDLELSALDHFLRLSRLTLAVLLPYVWFIAVGADVVNRACVPKLTALIAVISAFFASLGISCSEHPYLTYPFQSSSSHFLAQCLSFILVVGSGV